MSQVRQVKLDFPEKLLQSGKKENTEALLKRLKTLHQKLGQLEQDAVDIRSLEPVKKPLISHMILFHKDRGVKAYAACCLADLLRLYAPDAPYAADELRDIFQFYITQLTLNLKPPSNLIRPLQPSRTKSNEASQTQSQPQASQRVTEVPYYNEYCYLLDSLATIKSIVLACDVPGGDEIVTDFFSGFIDIVRADMSKNVIRHLTDILVWLIEESNTIPTGVFNCVIGQLEEASSKADNPAFQMIVDVCNRTQERFQRPVLAHISEVQLSHGRNPDTADQKALVDSHALLINMYRNCPGLLMLVIPVLEENLRAADEPFLRELSTKTLGTMFGERPVVGTGRADLAKAYPSTWRAWLGRKVDKTLGVRLAWVACARGILVSHPELRRDLEAELIDRVHDSDEKVRAAICKVIGTLDYETALHHVSVATLKAVGGRISDKRASVRSEAATALAKLWSLAYSEIEANDPDAVRHFAWIPEAILLSLIKKDATVELRTQITHIFKSMILPLPNIKDVDEQIWTDRLLLVASHLDDTAFKALEKLTGLPGYAKGSSPYRAFIDFCEANNGGIIDEHEEIVKARLAFVINAIAQTLFAEPEKAKKDMHAFADANEQRLYKLFKTCVDVQADLRTIIKARNELSRRIEQSHTEILDTFSTLVDSASWNILNHSSIPALIMAMQKSATNDTNHYQAIALSARRLVYTIAKHGAPMFKSHIPELMLVMADKKNERLSEAALQALAAVCKADPESAPTEDRLAERARRMAMQGNPRQAKFAARLLAYSKHSAQCKDLLEDVLADLDIEDQDHLLSHLAVLSELALSAPAAFEQRSEEIIAFVKDQVLAHPSPSSDDDNSNEWIEDAELQVHDLAKPMALRILTHRALSQSRSQDALTIVKPVLALLAEIIASEGHTTEARIDGGPSRCHLRYRAVACLIKLAKVKAFDKEITAIFETIATCLADHCFGVRYRILAKLGEVLPGQRLLPRWNLLPCLAANDNEPDNIALARSIIVSNVRACASFRVEDRIDRIEIPMARLLLVLTHHPDLNWEDPNNMSYFARFIDFYLDCVMNKDNVALLFHIASRIKCFRETGSAKMTGPEIEELIKENKLDDIPCADLYKLSEIAQQIIRNKAQLHQWAVHNYPGKVRFPSDIFHNLTDAGAVTAISKTKFLSDDVLAQVKSLGKRGVVAARRGHDRSSPVKRRAVASSSKQRSTKRARRRARNDDDDEDDEDDEDEDEEEEDEEEDGDEDGQEDGGADQNGEEGTDEEEVPVVGRGGKRGAKTRASKSAATKGRKKATSATRSSPVKPTSKGSTKPSAKKSSDVEMDDEEDEGSDLTDLD